MLFSTQPYYSVQLPCLCCCYLTMVSPLYCRGFDKPKKFIASQGICLYILFLYTQPAQLLCACFYNHNYYSMLHCLFSMCLLPPSPHKGPLPNTLVDFWRMMWQERPPIIVMLTNVMENNKIKCQQYWPDSGSVSYGPFTVTITDQQVLANYTVRNLLLAVST